MEIVSEPLESGTLSIKKVSKHETNSRKSGLFSTGSKTCSKSRNMFQTWEGRHGNREVLEYIYHCDKEKSLIL